MDNFIWGIAGSIAGALAVLLVQLSIRYWREERGQLTGQWDQVIPKSGAEPEKHDLVSCRDNGSWLKGKIERIEPIDQNFKKWRFLGLRRDALIFLVFWSTDKIRNPSSFGTIQLHFATSNCWEGFYVKLIVTSKGEQFTGQLEEFNLVWHLKRKV